MDIDAPAGQPLEAFLRSLHPALVACAPALAAQGVSTSSALLSLPRARILTLNDLSAVEKTLLLRRLPA